MEKVALISGITGQDGAYLADFLLNQGYLVHGVVRRTSSANTERLDHISAAMWQDSGRLQLHYGDLTDTSNTIRLVHDIRPHEIYNLAAQSHVQVSFETPEYTANADGVGTLRMLEAIRILGLSDTTRFYQASTSELYGGTQPRPQDELTAFNPRSPYAIAKLFAYWTTVNYREVYGMHASNGILFNHESPLRGETFVTRKITRAVATIAAGYSTTLKLGNLDARRDWGHAREYVRGMWLMLQQDYPDDYVLATGTCTSVRQFTQWAFEEIGITLDWRGEGVNETGYDSQTGQCLVEIDPKHFRPTEVDLLQGDASKAMRKLGWSPQITPRQLVQEMVEEDIRMFGARPRMELV